MKKFALIGTPIAHSLSPALFKACYPSGDMVYELLECPTIELSMAALKEGGYSGANVTAPYKEAIMQFVTNPDSVSGTLQAANLIILKEKQVFSYNTDYFAARKMVKEFIHSRANNQDSPKAIVIGCGGAGKAAALACRDENINTVIANRTISKAKTFASTIGIEAISIAKAEELLKTLSLDNLNSLKDILVIYTLPVAEPSISKELYSITTVIEANYKNPYLNHTSGLQWLEYQAAEGFKILTGITPNFPKQH